MHRKSWRLHPKSVRSSKQVLVLHTYPQKHSFTYMCISPTPSGLWFVRVWVSATLSRSSLPLYLGAGAVPRSTWPLTTRPKPPKRRVITQWLGSCQIRSWVKREETRNAPSPKTLIDKTPELSPQLDIRNPEQRPSKDQVQRTRYGQPQNMKWSGQNSED